MSTAHWIISASMIANYMPLDNEIPPSSFLNFTVHFNPQRQPEALEDHTLNGKYDLSLESQLWSYVIFCLGYYNNLLTSHCPPFLATLITILYVAPESSL